MKTIFVVDSINNINKKIEMFKNKFGNNIVFIVKSSLHSIFETYGFKANAVYTNKLPTIIAGLLNNDNYDDIVVYYSSFEIDDKFLNRFTNTIGDKRKVVNVSPSYNAFEKLNAKLYNIYVKTLFKVKDSMRTPKLQFIPSQFLPELLQTHFSNRLFELNEEHCREIEIVDKDINKSAKTKVPFNKNVLFSIIIALSITLVLILNLALMKFSFLLGAIYVVSYLIDIFITIILCFKSQFDSRFFK